VSPSAEKTVARDVGPERSTGRRALKPWMLAAAVVLAVVLGVLAALALRNPTDDGPSAGDAAGRRTAGEGSGSGPRTPVRSSSPIETTSASYFGRPFESIQIAGRYHGVHGRTILRVQLRQGRGWTQFPLPAVTTPSGRFHAYVELGLPGRYHVRLVDPARDRASRPVTLLVF
jgi:hypothetical protein